ncbi:aconitate hydratase [Tulasnella sp. 330]|nr:aconitate hydratase [Tulasnella sp. 330]
MFKYSASRSRCLKRQASPAYRERVLALYRTLATYAPLPEKDCTSITPPYDTLLETLGRVRKVLNRPLTLAEKILYSHLCNPEENLSGTGKIRGERYLQLRPQRVAMQDASAQMALLQFMTCGLPSSTVPASIHCDHLIQAVDGADADLKRSIISNKEVFDFLESAAKKYGIEFWKPGSGIIHQIVLENYAAPGMLMLGTDSHTPNAGGLGMLAIGVGGADAVDAMTGTPWELKAPRVIGVHLKGKMSGWTTPKDLILHIAGKLTVKETSLDLITQGGTGSILEYFGPGVHTQSCTGLATIANMGAELGATTSTFPYTQSMRQYLNATGRAPVARAADEAQKQGLLERDEGAEWDDVVEIDLSTLEPTINGPFTPDLATPVSKFGSFIKEQGWKDELSAGLIGSCTNSSYEDMSRVTSIARQAKAAGLKAKVPFLCTPGSEQIRATIERDGLTEALEDVGAVVLANACGPCIGQWKREDFKGEENAILTSFNRNFKARNDANSKTMNFLSSPEIVTAMAFSGRLSFNPLTDSLQGADGKPFKFSPPTGDISYTPSPTPAPLPATPVAISPESSRLEILAPFPREFPNARGMELPALKCLMRVRGKCTTDHISAAGPWLKFKGHLSNISENTLITATNDESGKVNSAVDLLPGQSTEDTIPAIAKRFKAREEPWALVKQGILPLWFADKNDYQSISAGDVLETEGVTDILEGNTDTQVHLIVTKPNGEKATIQTRHTLSADQAKWIKAGSALNYIREQKAAGK